MGFDQTEARGKAVGQATDRGDALADFLSWLRAGVDHVRVDRRECRSTVCIDPKNSARGPEAYRHRGSQPFIASDVGGESSSVGQGPPPEVVLCDATKERPCRVRRQNG